MQLPVGAVASVPEPGVAVTVLACAAGVMRRAKPWREAWPLPKAMVIRLIKYVC